MFKIVNLLHSKNVFINKGVIRRYVIIFGHKNSFRHQILNYFENIHNARTALEQYEISTQVRKAAVKNQFNSETFESICEQIKKISGDITVRRNLVKTFDNQCLDFIKSLSHSEILNLLSLFSKILPTKELITTQFYESSMDLLFQALGCELLTQQEIVQLLFFISLKKDEARSYIKYLKLFLPEIKDMALIDKCIVAEAFYKSSLKLDQSQCRALEEVLSEKSEKLVSNPYLLVPLCKAIRLSKPTSQLNLRNLSNAILCMDQPFDIKAAIHILSLYAEALLHEPASVTRLVKDCIQIIDQSGSDLRLKDIDRFLWSISRLGLGLKKDEKQLLLRIVETRLPELKEKERVGFLVNCLLSLHILECWNPKLVELCLKENVFEPIYYEKFHWKVRSRLHLLIRQIDIEMNLDIPPALEKEIRIAHTVPEEIETAEKILNSLVEEKIVQSVTVECPVKGLLIPGISLATEKCLYHIDLLNNFTCLRDTSIPHGLMKLKSRLLTHLEYHHILIDGALGKDPSEIRATVQEQICRKASKS